MRAITMTRIRLGGLVLGFAICAAFTAAASTPSDPLMAAFMAPPDSARPRVWWHWMDGNITQEGIDLDLAWMKRSGLGGLQTFDVSLMTPQVVQKRLAYMTPEWRAAFRHAAQRADELGLEMTIAASAGWSETGGPWVKPAQAMKKLVWSQTEVEGGRAFRGVLKAPPTVTGPFQEVPAFAGPLVGHSGPEPLPSYFADSAVVAYRTADRAKPIPKPLVSSSAGPIDGAALTDADLTTKATLSCSDDKPCWILYDFGTPTTIRSSTVAVGAVPIFGGGALSAYLEASDDAATFRPVTQIPISQIPQQTASFAAVTARYFRLLLKRAARPLDLFGGAAPGADFAGLAAVFGMTNATTPPIELATLTLSGEPKINQFELKAGFGVARDYYALETSARNSQSGVSTSEVIDLTARMAPNGRLDWTPPKGRWIVLRLGYSLIGTENHPATPEATGLEVDKLNSDDVKTYINTYLDRYAEFLGPELLGSHGVRALINDSIEVGAQNWTDDILAQFQKRRGYDPRPWLPALTGVVVGDGVKSDAFLYDFRRTIAELTAQNHYAVVAEAAHARGLIIYGEALEDGRPSFGDDLEMRRYTDIPMAAMWTYNRDQGPKPTYLADIRGAASVAHLYGQNLVAAESMTSAVAPWAFAPRDLKSVIDLEFALGVNRPVIHTSVHQPLIDKKPGLSLSIFGQYFNRNETWAEQARPWVDYLARSSFLLQQGRFFADVAYFTGEEAPLTGQFGEHETDNLPHGYAFDFVNAELVNNRLTVKDGCLVASTGASYHLLFLGGSSQRMTLATLTRIHDLVESGAVVAGLRPVSSPALSDDATAFNRMADSLWSTSAIVKSVGQGKVMAVTDPDKALALLGLVRDFDDGEPQQNGKVMFVHRKLADGGDIYYIDNRDDRPQHLEARFRVTGKAPELWHAQSGAANPVSFRIANGVTTVPLSLEPDEAAFVVFRKPAAQLEVRIPAVTETVLTNLQGPWTLAFESGRGAPATARFDHLYSWTQSADPGIRYFSGAAHYTRLLKVTSQQLKGGARLILDLGDVRDLAEVSVNGALLGTVWHPPYRVELTGALKPGANQVDIKVVNTWVNRLIGDQQPGAERVAFTVIPTYTAQAPLRPSGLIGPVRLIEIQAGL